MNHLRLFRRSVLLVWKQNKTKQNTTMEIKGNNFRILIRLIRLSLVGDQFFLTHMLVVVVGLFSMYIGIVLVNEASDKQFDDCFIFAHTICVYLYMCRINISSIWPGTNMYIYIMYIRLSRLSLIYLFCNVCFVPQAKPYTYIIYITKGLLNLVRQKYKRRMPSVSLPGRMYRTSKTIFNCMHRWRDMYSYVLV